MGEEERKNQGGKNQGSKTNEETLSRTLREKEKENEDLKNKCRLIEMELSRYQAKLEVYEGQNMQTKGRGETMEQEQQGATGKGKHGKGPYAKGKGQHKGKKGKKGERDRKEGKGKEWMEGPMPDFM